MNKLHTYLGVLNSRKVHKGNCYENQDCRIIVAGHRAEPRGYKLRTRPDKTVKIGSLSDQSGLYADLGGPGSTLAAQMAVEDSGLTAKGWKIDVISGDHQNKPDVGVNIARQWFDVDKVDVDCRCAEFRCRARRPTMSFREKNGVYINSGAATSDLTNAQCSPNTVHWTYDTYMLAHSTGQALVKSGGDHCSSSPRTTLSAPHLSAIPRPWSQANGGKVLGGVKHPFEYLRIFRRSCCRPRRRRPKSSGWRMPVATRTNSHQAGEPNSAS